MQKAIITGASKGLGEAFAYELVSRGYQVLLIARSENLLKILAAELNKKSLNAEYLSMDLSHPESVRNIITWCKSNNFFPDVLINNAGFACWGYFEDIPLENQIALLNLHIQTTVALTHEMLPFLKQQTRSYILNVCSTAAYQAVPTMTIYAASKSFIRSFSRGLRFELRHTNVSVTCLSPGPIATNFIEAANMHAMQQDAKKFEMQPNDVAKRGIKAMFEGRAEIIPGWMNSLSVRLSKIIPDFLLEKIANNLYESKLK